MIMLYFSGTGNSKYVAQLFCSMMNIHSDQTANASMAAQCYSIEENINFKELISSHEIVGFCYPIYRSRVPRIMREFAGSNIDCLKDKKIIIFCTQWIFSGDGARVFTYIFPRNYVKVIYAEHFLMPNNVNNLFILPIESGEKIKKYLVNAERKMQIVHSAAYAFPFVLCVILKIKMEKLLLKVIVQFVIAVLISVRKKR